jgi:hypothetical protein
VASTPRDHAAIAESERRLGSSKDESMRFAQIDKLVEQL